MRDATLRLFSRFLAAAALSVATLAGCTTESGDDFASELAGNREKWERNRPARYAYTLYRSCFCPPEYVGPFLVVAAGDSVLSARRIEMHPPAGAPETTSVAGNLQELSIDTAFARSESMLGKDHDRESAVFDPRYGFPASVSVDNPRMADYFWGIHISDFRPSDGE